MFQLIHRLFSDRVAELVQNKATRAYLRQCGYVGSDEGDIDSVLSQ